MAAEFTNNAVQTILPNQNAVFTETPVRCCNGNVSHREGSGIFTLRGRTNQCKARYRVTFNGNIAVPTGGTAGAISIALAIAGEPLYSTIATVTPAAVENYFNVSVSGFIEVDRGCCLNIAVENVSTQAINLANPNLIIDRVA